MFTISAVQQHGQSIHRLSGALTIYAVAEARPELAAVVAGQKFTTLDLSEVDELDTAGVQLLLWLKREAGRQGATLALVLHSPAVVEVFDLLQVTAAFGDPILIAPNPS